MIAFRYTRLETLEEIRAQIAECEGRHVQQAIYSTFMGALTQICFTEKRIRGMIEWDGDRSWVPEPAPADPLAGVTGTAS